jgi:hypothetical protein
MGKQGDPGLAGLKELHRTSHHIIVNRIEDFEFKRRVAAKSSQGSCSIKSAEAPRAGD